MRIVDEAFSEIGQVLDMVESVMVEYDHQSGREIPGGKVVEDLAPIQAALKRLWLAERSDRA